MGMAYLGACADNSHGECDQGNFHGDGKLRRKSVLQLNESLKDEMFLESPGV